MPRLATSAPIRLNHTGNIQRTIKSLGPLNVAYNFQIRKCSQKFDILVGFGKLLFGFGAFTHVHLKVLRICVVLRSRPPFYRSKKLLN